MIAQDDVPACRELVAELAARHLAPPALDHVDEWVESHWSLDRRSSAEPGPYRIYRTPHVREPMRMWTRPDVRHVVLMWGAQMAKTSVALGAIGRTIDVDPQPILFVSSVEESLRKFSRKKLDPLLESPRIKARVSERKSRDSARTQMSVEFEQGSISLASSNSPAALASESIGLTMFDEVDRYPPSAGDEGDAITLGLTRATTYPNAKALFMSTPDIEGASRIEQLFEEGDQRRWHVPCPSCGTAQVLVWEQVRWADRDPRTAWYQCEGCDARWDDATRWRAISEGEWVATKPFNGTVSYHISQLASLFVELADLVDQWLKAQGKPEQLQAFLNLVLAQTWSIESERVPPELPLESWDADFPTPVCLLVAFADVQGDRIECTVAGVSADESLYVIEHRKILGPTKQDGVWQALDDYARKSWTRADGREFKLTALGVDCGFEFERATTWATRPHGCRVYPIKGFGRGVSEPIVRERKASQANSGRRFYAANSDASKLSILQRLQLESGPGRVHFPVRACFGDEYFKQLRAEKLVRRHVRGFPKLEWRKAPGARNEALDCLAGVVATWTWLNPVLEVIAARVPELPPRPEDPDAPEAPAVAPAPVVAAPQVVRRARIVRRDGGGAWFDRPGRR